jgi:xylulokinase
VAAGTRVGVIGLDIGTSSTKGILVDAAGGIVARASSPHRIVVGPAGLVEVDADDVEHAVLAVIARLAARARLRGLTIGAVCAGGSGDEAAWLGADGRPVGRVPMSADTRAASDAAAIAARVGRGRFAAMTGLPPAAAYPATRMRWLRRVDPERAARVRLLLAWPELVAARLGVAPASEPTLAARSGVFVTETGAGSGAFGSALLGASGVDAGTLPPRVSTGAIVGRVEPATATRLGLPAGVVVVAGGFDQAMATLGAGVHAPGTAHVGAGSWEALTVLRADRPDPALVEAGFSVGPSIGAGGCWSVMGSAPGATVLAWLGGAGRADGDGSASSTRASVRRVFELAAISDDRPSAVIAIPGSGVIAGMDLGTRPQDIALAMIEGVAIALAGRLGRVTAAGHPIDELRITGGGARGRRWLRLRADVTGIPVRPVRPRDAGAAAAAALALVALGLAADVPAAVAAVASVGRPILPRPGFVDAYRAKAARVGTLEAGVGRAGPAANRSGTA